MSKFYAFAQQVAYLNRRRTPQNSSQSSTPFLHNLEREIDNISKRNQQFSQQMNRLMSKIDYYDKKFNYDDSPQSRCIRKRALSVQKVVKFQRVSFTKSPLSSKPLLSPYNKRSQIRIKKCDDLIFKCANLSQKKQDKTNFPKFQQWDFEVFKKQQQDWKEVQEIATTESQMLDMVSTKNYNRKMEIRMRNKSLALKQQNQDISDFVQKLWPRNRKRYMRNVFSPAKKFGQEMLT